MVPIMVPLAVISATNVVPVNVGLTDKTLFPAVPVTAVAPVPPCVLST